ncbi:winged helix-turn-helix transcriptional regulator [Candidatus Woesearchaeota archaeon]|nr:winged helix-turn-helix transcriptional regulator [Candidatus Woesearchaeota archaeon]
MVFRRITIIKVRQSHEPDVNEQLQVIGASLGLFSLRDKDRSCFRIFITLIHSMRQGAQLSSDEIAHLTGLTRGTVVHHLNKLMAGGIVEMDRGRYVLTFNSIEELINRVETNVQKTLEGLRVTAQDVDDKLKLN